MVKEQKEKSSSFFDSLGRGRKICLRCWENWGGRSG